MVDELLVKLRQMGFECIGYADDLVIIVSGKFEDTICDRMQVALNFVSEWCQQSNLSVNAIKTVLVPSIMLATF